jgi:hypothetical protein
MGDQYRWQRPGQYVPYDAAADADGMMRAGLYLVRVTADPEHRLSETRENDNIGYVFIKVIDGRHLQQRPRGRLRDRQGRKPLGPRKTVVPARSNAPTA